MISVWAVFIGWSNNHFNNPPIILHMSCMICAIINHNVLQYTSMM